MKESIKEIDDRLRIIDKALETPETLQPGEQEQLEAEKAALEGKKTELEPQRDTAKDGWRKAQDAVSTAQSAYDIAQATYNAAVRGEDQALSDYADAVDSAWRA